MNCSTPGFLVLPYLLEFVQIHVHRKGIPPANSLAGALVCFMWGSMEDPIPFRSVLVIHASGTEAPAFFSWSFQALTREMAVCGAIFQGAHGRHWVEDGSRTSHRYSFNKCLWLLAASPFLCATSSPGLQACGSLEYITGETGGHVVQAGIGAPRGKVTPEKSNLDEGATGILEEEDHANKDSEAKSCDSNCCCLVIKSCPTLCTPMNCSPPGLPVTHYLPQSVPVHVHWVGDAIQPSHPLSSPSPPALNLSQHQGPFQ